MFCPSCGSEERQASQFCRGCGVDLRAVRMGLERPDSVTASAVSARDEIGRAVADKIRSVNNAGELKIVADAVLPQVAKFLESPEEKRLRRLRVGVITSLTGLGVWLPSLALTEAVTQEFLGLLFTLIGFGALAFMVGLAFVLNGLLFTRPRKAVDDHSAEKGLQDLLKPEFSASQLRPGDDAQSSFRAQTTSNLSKVSGSSVTEHTTLNLKKE